MESERKNAVDKKISTELLVEMKQKFLLMPQDISHEERGRRLRSQYPQFSIRTLGQYSSVSLNVCDEAFQAMLDGKISISALEEFVVFNEGTQKYLVSKWEEEKLSPSLLRKIKMYTKEGKMGHAEAIGRAKGVIPEYQPRKEQRKTLDQVLTQIADLGARWRALVAMALELVGEEEASAGVHEMIFNKAFLLRQMIGEQYDFANAKVLRQMNVIRKRIKELQDGVVEETDKKDDKIVDAEFVERAPEKEPTEE